MTVDREVIERPLHSGRAIPVGAVRQKSGSWTVTLEVDMEILTGDGRRLRVKRQVRTKAEQIGRRKA